MDFCRCHCVAKALWLLSYNDCDAIRALYSVPGIYIEKIERLNNMAQRYDPGNMYQELLISNYDTVVVFETLYRDKLEVCTHADIEDKDQTVTFSEKPEIKTSYDEVFIGDVDCKNLEDVFTMLNTRGHPLHRGHSLSVSDVVLTENGAYFCDTIGFAPAALDVQFRGRRNDLVKGNAAGAELIVLDRRQHLFDSLSPSKVTMFAT